MNTPRTAFLLILAVSLLPAADLSHADEGNAGTVIYLIRHAEKAAPKADDPRDPPLNETGLERAQSLAHILRDADVSRIFSTDYRRTRQTVEPLAKRNGLTIESYDPSDLGGFAARLKRMSSRTVVSGHSNTTPDLVRALGGNPGKPIDENEYDRLYVLVLLRGGGVETVLIRY